MKESKMSQNITPSLTRKLFNMALLMGDDVIDLTLGDPDIIPPIEIREAACKAVKEGKTRYSANAGLLELREKYATWYKNQYGITYNPKENVIVTVGGMEALFLALASILDKEDEVILLGPYYVNYYQMINMCQGVPIVVDRLSKTDEELLCAIYEKITKRTVAIIVNSPCNPVGDMLSSKVLDGIARIAKEKNLIVISDEVYSSLVYDNERFESIVTRQGMLHRTIVIDSCSKRFAMTGWRVGFAVGPQDIISNMIKMQENVAACAPLPSQYAAIKAYSDEVEYEYIKNEYEQRRNLVYSALSKINGLEVIRPTATFYCLVDISAMRMDCETFAYRLLEEQHVAVVPGKAYGEVYDRYIRIAFTLEENVLIEAMGRITDFCAKYYISEK